MGGINFLLAIRLKFITMNSYKIKFHSDIFYQKEFIPINLLNIDFYYYDIKSK